ncbi:YcnI family protein [Nocardioides euryhalodurans]|uniref:DUF1775 domain-containing protein n=1 Tax=Nocardioides euryhalodurans TaxID=2518370 RepID=A0A4P7GNF4_9ACTN|nr:YcnI family protein [Nocardioides euryhalodurans]QBR93603.1 DUF1775 domain-containing protein [Nocardioides euryhalodurans]
MSRRTLTRLGALTAATGIAALVAAPAQAHVSGTPSVANAGSYTVLTMSVPHGCEGSPTTRIEIQVPESVLSVTPTRNPLYDLEANIEQLDEPVSDAHGNEVTERTGSIVYTAKEPLPEGQRDTFELSFQVPDAAGEQLVFPTIQTCEQGETGWVEVPQEGQDAEELEHPAPSFEILPASEEGDGHSDEEASDTEAAATSDSADGTQEAAATTDGTSAVGWAGLVLGALGLVAGGTALARTRKPA